MSKKAHSEPAKKSGKHSETVSHTDGSFMGIRIADPAVKPKGTTVRQIRKAVAAVARKRA